MLSTPPHSANFMFNGNAYGDNVRLSVTPIPEPSALALAALGLMGLTFFTRRGKK